LFARVKTWRVWQGERYPLPDTDNRLHNVPPARRFEDYAITVDRDGMPTGVELIER
jgi:CRISPR-associated protein Csd2